MCHPGKGCESNALETAPEAPRRPYFPRSRAALIVELAYATSQRREARPRPAFRDRNRCSTSARSGGPPVAAAGSTGSSRGRAGRTPPALAAKKHATRAQLALAWLLAQK